MYTLEKGIPETQLRKWLQARRQELPSFDDNRIDYHHAEIAPIIMCTMAWGGKVLLAKRVEHPNRDASGKWSTINGYIDKIRTPQSQTKKEVLKETGVRVNPDQIRVANSYIMRNPEERRAYLIYPTLITFQKRPQIQLDWEHEEYRWIARQDIEPLAERGELDILEDLPRHIDAALALRFGGKPKSQAL